MHNPSMNCQISGRPLGQADDPLSVDCGGDYWDCVGQIEAAMGEPTSLDRVRDEFARGLRPGWVDPVK
jgi:hypothetical protein